MERVQRNRCWSHPWVELGAAWVERLLAKMSWRARRVQFPRISATTYDNKYYNSSLTMIFGESRAFFGERSSGTLSLTAS